MALQFTKEEVERDYADHLIQGDRKAIAENSGLGYEHVRRLLNPNDRLPSSFLVTLKIQCAFDDRDPERAEKAWQDFCQKRELSKKRPAGNLCLNLATAKLNTEVAEYVAAKMSGKPLDIQIREFLDVERELRVLKKALLDEYKRLKLQSPEMASVAILS